ncbi:MAG TPA: JAB domain-containing protein [Chitinophagaceae bacterium]|nr:JAB domain-containing protein [Chitinophagaceae bacterium]
MDWQQITEIEVSYKTTLSSSERPRITDAQDAYRILLQSWNKDKIELVEQFKVLFLNRDNKVLGVYDVSSGGLTDILVDPRLIFAAALKANAVSVILAHNHPSGNVKPSRADRELTSRIKQGGELLAIDVIDHIIITKDGFLSLADEGLL